MLKSKDILNELSDDLKIGHGINVQNAIVLGENENLVIGINGKVVRITLESHRNKPQIEAEIELIQELRSHGCAVPEILLSSSSDAYMVVNTIIGRVYLVVFKELKCVGNLPKEEGEMRNACVKEWGRTMGAIHRVTSGLKLKNSKNRMIWNEEVIVANASELIPAEDTDVLEGLKEVKLVLSTFDTSSSNFGLTHTDMRPRNFAYSNGAITHFDFDDICHHWFLYDVAVSAFHEIEAINGIEARTRFAYNFLIHLLSGYIMERPISKSDISRLVVFMKLRCIYACIDYYKRLKIKGMDSGKDKMIYRRNFIQNFSSFLDFPSLEDKLLLSLQLYD